MRFLLVLISAAACSAETDLYVFGISRHTYHEECSDGLRPKEQNPGAGLGVMLPVGESWEAGVTVGWYTDSRRDLARFALPTIRYTWADRVCVDAGAGYYRGSCFYGFGGLITVGVRIIGPLWVQGVYVPPAVTRVDYGVGVAFLRVRL